MKTNRFKHMTLAAAIFGLGAVAAQAAPLTININGGGAGLSCVDQAACDSSAVLGAIAFSVLFADLAGTGYDVVNLTANSYPDVGTPGLPILRLGVDLSSNASGLSNSTPLTIRATQTSFTLNGLSSFDLGSTVNFPAIADASSPLATVGSSYFLDNANAPFGTVTLLGGNTFTFTGTNVSAQSNNQTVSGNPDGSFSLTDQLVISGVDASRALTASQAISAVAQAVPEPTSMALAGAAMLGLSLTRLRRRKQG